MAEQFRLEQVGGYCRAVDTDERLLAPIALLVSHPGELFLAGTGLAEQHDRRIAARDLNGGAYSIHQGRAGTEDAMGQALFEHGLDSNAVPQVLVFLYQVRGLVDHELVDAQHLPDHRCGDAQQADIAIKGAFMQPLPLYRQHADGRAGLQYGHGNEGHPSTGVIGQLGYPVDEQRLLVHIRYQADGPGTHDIAGHALIDIQGKAAGFQVIHGQSIGVTHFHGVGSRDRQADPAAIQAIQL